MVADHKIGGGGILVDQQGLCAGGERFDDIGRLRGRAGGVVGAEVARIAAVRQVIDKGRDVDAFDASAVLGADLNGGRVADDEFAAVAGDVVIDTAL